MNEPVLNFVEWCETYIFGTYTPCTTLIDSTNNIYETSINWGYICSVVIFCIVLYMVLKCVGGVIRAICNK